MKRISIFVLSAMIFAACGGGASTSEETTMDAEMESHEGHDHDHDHGATAGDGVPAVPVGAKVFFANLEDGATVSSPVYVEFGVEGMEVEPAGLVKEGFGHHHIIIDGNYTLPGEAVPADDTHIHYGGGQMGDTLTLAPGVHTLTMQFADGLHRSYGEQMSATISVTVE